MQRRLRIEAGCILGADREVRHEDVGLGFSERGRNVDRFGGRFDDALAVVAAEAVEGRPALNGDSQLGDVGETDGVVLSRPHRFGDVFADLGRVDVECRNDLDVADVVPAQLDVHQTGYVVARVGVPVVADALDEGVRTVADAGDGHAHGGGSAHDDLPGCGGASVRARAIRSSSHWMSASTRATLCRIRARV